MLAARMHGYKQPLVIEEVNIPEISSDQVLVRVGGAGMCRSDVQLIDGYFEAAIKPKFPITPGHEIAGLVETLGDHVPETAQLAVGDQVVVSAGWGDGTCRQCRAGNEQICEHGSWPGFGPPGGYAEFIAVPYRQLIRVEHRLNWEELAPAGKSKLDAVIDCVSAVETIQTGFGLLATSGAFVSVGLVGNKIDIPLFPFVAGEFTYHGSFWANYSDLQEVLALAQQGKIQHSIKRLRFNDINENLELLRSGDIIGRAVIVFDVKVNPSDRKEAKQASGVERGAAQAGSSVA